MDEAQRIATEPSWDKYFTTHTQQGLKKAGVEKRVLNVD